MRITWLDAKGQRSHLRRPCRDRLSTRLYPVPRPSIRPTRPPTAGWTEVSEHLPVPSKAPQAVVELRLLWAPGGKIRWSQVSLKETAPPAGRKVRLAAVHFQPRGGKTPAENRRQFAPLLEEAARQKADLVVLGECLTMAGNGCTARTSPSRSRSFDRIFRPVGQAAQFLYRGRAVRAGSTPDLQHGGPGGARRQVGGQVPQGGAAPRRDRLRASPQAMSIRSFRPASARWA